MAPETLFAEVKAIPKEEIDAELGNIVSNHTLLMELIEEIKGNPEHLAYFRDAEQKKLRDRLDKLAEEFEVKFALSEKVKKDTKDALAGLKEVAPPPPTTTPPAKPDEPKVEDEERAAAEKIGKDATLGENINEQIKRVANGESAAELVRLLKKAGYNQVTEENFAAKLNGLNQKLKKMGGGVKEFAALTDSTVKSKIDGLVEKQKDRDFKESLEDFYEGSWLQTGYRKAKEAFSDGKVPNDAWKVGGAVLAGVAIVGSLYAAFSGAAKKGWNKLKAGMIIVGGGAVLGILGFLGFKGYGLYKEYKDEIDAAKQALRDAEAKIEEGKKVVKEAKDAVDAKINATQLGLARREWESVRTSLNTRKRGPGALKLSAMQLVLKGSLKQLDEPTEKAFLKEIGVVDAADKPQPVILQGPTATVRYEVTYEPSTKDFKIRDVSERELLKPDIAGENTRGIFALRDLPEVGPGKEVPAKPDQGVLDAVLLGNPAIREIKLAALAPLAGKTFDAMKDQEPMKIFASLNDQEKSSLFFFLKSLHSLKEKYLRGKKTNAELNVMTVEQGMDELGLYLRFYARFDANRRHVAELTLGLQKAFTPIFGQESKSPAVHRKLEGLPSKPLTGKPIDPTKSRPEDKHFAGHEEAFMTFMQGNAGLQLSSLPSASIDVPDESVDAVRKGVAALQQYITSARPVLDGYIDELIKAKPAASAQLKKTFGDALNSLTSADALQLFFYLEETKYHGDAEPRKASDSPHMIGQNLVSLKLVELLSRREPELAKDIFKDPEPVTP